MRTPGAAARPRLLSLSTAVPEHVLDQQAVAAAAERQFAPSVVDFARMLPVFANAGIRTRYSVRPMDWFVESQDWASRTAAYLEAASGLFIRAAAAALEAAGLHATAIDTVVTVSSTGIATPSVEALAHGALGLRQDVRRVPVFGLGCAGGATGLALAARLAAAEPGARVLLVVVELCTLAFRGDEASKSNIVATALFGDGAAAAVLCAGRGDGLAELEHGGEHLWPDTLDMMGWRIDPIGFSAVFARSIPSLVTEALRPATEAFLRRQHLSLADIGFFVFHPGGARVVEALEGAFDLPPGQLRREREVLRDFGNMSAPTLLFVLRKALDEGVAGRGLLAALGPGFTASFLTVRA